MDDAALREACRATLDGLGGGDYVSLPALEAAGHGAVSRLPVCLRVLLENQLRHCGTPGSPIGAADVSRLAAWRPDAARVDEVSFMPGRVVLNCTAGIPMLCDLAALRDAAIARGLPADAVQPRIPADMTLDHTLTVDHAGTPDALPRNMALEIERNAERFAFVKWAVQAFGGIRLVPPGMGILHQLNLEHFAPGLLRRAGWLCPDTLVGTDSHTCMIAGLGTLGWGVGGIEAEAALLGLPVSLLVPDVVGVHLQGALAPGATATDLVLHLTSLLRTAKVVGKFVEFLGPGVAALTVPDRATLANMAPEYGATLGYFPPDRQTCDYLAQTGRAAAEVSLFEAWWRAQGCFGGPRRGEVDYSRVIEVDLGAVRAAVAGPKRPQDLVPLPDLPGRWAQVLRQTRAEGGFGVAEPEPVREPDDVAHGDVVIAAITSCTSTSNPGLMLAAGLLARAAHARGLRPAPWVKTSLAPGSRVVSRYLEAAGLQASLDALGFSVVGYSCSTCVGNSGDLKPGVEARIEAGDRVACAVLSGNRNFEARIHRHVRAAFLASPPMVVAFALAGRIGIDFEREPLGTDADGAPVFLRELWPTPELMAQALGHAADPAHYREVYAMDVEAANPGWRAIEAPRGPVYPWAESSTYIRRPPFLFEPALMRSALADLDGARALAVLGDSVTTDHISPIGRIEAESPAGRWLAERGVAPRQFNNYGARRMNHELMTRGTFANVRLRNRLVEGVEGNATPHPSQDRVCTFFEAAEAYAREGVPLLVFAGEEYGTGSARDWAAKGTRLLGVRAVIASGFERIHRSNLVGLGVLPCEFADGWTTERLAPGARDRFAITGLADAGVRAPLVLHVRRDSGEALRVPLRLRADTPTEIAYLRAGGVLPYVLRTLTDAP